MIKDYSIVKSLLIEDEYIFSKNILQQIINETGADFLLLYFLSLSTGKYKLFTSYGNDQLSTDYPSIISLEEITNESEDIPKHIFHENKLVFLITRKKSCIGFLEIYKKNIDDLPKECINKFDNISTLLLVVYERRFINNMLKKIQEPINFEAIGHEEFFKEIMNTIKVASGMQLIALREFTDEKDLKCLGVSGFGEVNNLEFSITQNDIPDEFLEVIIDDKTITVPKAQEVEWIRKNPLLKDVHSFIAIPIRVGASIFGILSFATITYYLFSNTEILALESIANGIGVSITNYRNFNKSKMDIARYNETAVSLTGLEIAQATRHEAKNKIDNCQFILANLLNSKKEQISDREEDLIELSQTLNEVKVTLNKIKTATKPPVKKKEIESIRTIWDQAVSALSGRLSNMDVNVIYTGKEPRIEMYSEWLRHAFLNLLLNSMDAFKRGGKKRGKTISLSIDKFPADFQKISMAYQDNAGGIDIQNLEIPVECSKFADNMNRLIFAPNVTSKGEEGSGWGLFLVRKSIEYHKGSINLTKHRGGVSFKIEMFKEIPKGK
jgi:nitrogen-specific signal transduction histidine kinase